MMTFPGKAFRCAAEVIALACLCTLVSVAQTAPPSNPPPAAPAAAPASQAVLAGGDYKLGAQDLLQITIFESPDLSREVRVAGDGMISMPLLAERIYVLGLTIAAAEDLLKQKYREAGILNSPNIAITLKEIQSKPVTVMGAVRMPGVFQVGGQAPLLRLITQAGGMTDDAGETITIVRGGPGGVGSGETLTVQVDDIREGRVDGNMPVFGGDTINVSRAGFVYVVGGVNRPGRYTLRNDTDPLTVLRLLAMAEDLKSNNKADKSVIIRRDPARCPKAPCGQDAMQQIPVDRKSVV